MTSKLNCEIVRDLLPTYVDELAEEETQQLIKEHLAECEACRQFAQDLDNQGANAQSENRIIQDALKEQNRKYKKMRKGLLGLVGLVLVVFIGINMIPVIQGMSVTQAQKDQLMEQVVTAEPKELVMQGVTGLSDIDKWFGHCKIFGMERKGDDGYIYAQIGTDEYIKIKDKAYNVSGGRSPVTLHVKFSGDSIKLLKMEEPMEGELLLQSIRKDFPLFSYLRWRMYDNGNDSMQGALHKKVKEAWGVSVSENGLDIKGDKYTIYRIEEDYDSTTLEEGTFSELKKQS